MPTVDENRLRGNYAQAVVSSWLSRSCLIRPVAEGTDIGIDLYCEAVLASRPSHHFWAQVNAIPEEAVEDGEAACRFQRKHLAYWKRQPIPMYAFLVPLGEWPAAEPTAVYGIRISEHLARHGLPAAESITLRTRESFERSSVDDDIEVFLSTIVPWDTAALQLQRGVISRLPGPQTGSLEGQFVRDIGTEHLPEVLLTIRDATTIGLIESLLAETEDPKWRSLRQRFQVLAECLEEEMQPLGVSALVRAAHHDQEIERARAYAKRALERIETRDDLAEDEREHCAAQMHVLLDELDGRAR